MKIFIVHNDRYIHSDTYITLECIVTYDINNSRNRSVSDCNIQCTQSIMQFLVVVKYFLHARTHTRTHTQVHRVPQIYRITC